MGKMSLSVYMKGRYEEFYALGRRKNKANSKPNKANFGDGYIESSNQLPFLIFLMKKRLIWFII